MPWKAVKHLSTSIHHNVFDVPERHEGWMMPRARTSDPKSEHVEAMLVARAEFEAGFKRSKKGNLWRRWAELTLCVFKRGDGYAWSIADSEGVRFSVGTYESEAEAIGGLWDETEGEGWR